MDGRSSQSLVLLYRNDATTAMGRIADLHIGEYPMAWGNPLIEMAVFAGLDRRGNGGIMRTGPPRRSNPFSADANAEPVSVRGQKGGWGVQAGLAEAAHTRPAMGFTISISIVACRCGRAYREDQL